MKYFIGNLQGRKAAMIGYYYIIANNYNNTDSVKGLVLHESNNCACTLSGIRVSKARKIYSNVLTTCR